MGQERLLRDGRLGDSWEYPQTSRACGRKKTNRVPTVREAMSEVNHLSKGYLAATVADTHRNVADERTERFNVRIGISLGQLKLQKRMMFGMEDRFAYRT